MHLRLHALVKEANRMMQSGGELDRDAMLYRGDESARDHHRRRKRGSNDTAGAKLETKTRGRFGALMLRDSGDHALRVICRRLEEDLHFHAIKRLAGLHERGAGLCREWKFDLRHGRDCAVASLEIADRLRSRLQRTDELLRCVG